MSEPTIRIGGVVPTPVGQSETSTTLCLLLWGDAGSGKTTFACTAPGKKLLINFDLNGAVSIRHVPDVEIADLSDTNQTVTEGFKSHDNPLNLKAYINHFDTVIIDSLTSAIRLTLERGIAANRGSTIERPSPGAYGTRNALAHQLIRNVTRLCVRQRKHVVFTAHEDAAVLDKDGNVVKISISLGGKLVSQVPPDVSEVWHLSIGGDNKRRVAIGPVRYRTPMKSRMFHTEHSEFVWTSKVTLASLIDKWAANSYQKINLPT